MKLGVHFACACGLGLALALPAGALAASPGAPKKGQVRICRSPFVVEPADGKPVDVPADTYTGEQRSFVVAAPGVHLGPGKRACAVVTGVVERDDGRPIAAGETLVPQHPVPDFTPTVKAASAFR